MLKIEHLTKKFGDFTAVDDLSIDVEAGQIYAFIGHNGAGKTTAIKAAVGIQDFDEGTITIDGHDIRREPMECKRVLAYIPDNPDIYEYMTAIQYLNFIGDIFEVPTAKRQELIDKYADMFEIKDKLAQPISSFSHGMKQKVVIIGALIHEPRLIIMDEPFVGLDPKATFLLKGVMREMCDNGAAIFFSTHVLDVAEKLCDMVAIIKQGKLITSGTMEEVKGNDSLEQVFLELEDK